MTDSPESSKKKAKKNRKQRQAPRPVGPAALTGSTDAKRLAAGILDILAGLRTTSDGAAALGISLPRYYVLETRVVQAIVNACEPLPRGRQRTPQDKINELEAANDKLRREVSRLQAVMRAAQRSIGLPSSPPSQAKAKAGNSGKAKAKRKRKQTPRAQKMIAALRKPAPPAGPSERTPAPTSPQT